MKGGGEDDRMENAGSAAAKDLRPHDGELIVLHMIPKSAWGRSERYLTGRLQTVAGRTWMNSGGNVVSPAELRKHYDLRWLRLPEDTI